MDEEEVEAEVEVIQEDEEVECIYNDAKDKYRQIMIGTRIFSVLSNVSDVLCNEYYVFNDIDVEGLKTI